MRVPRHVLDPAEAPWVTLTRLRPTHLVLDVEPGVTAWTSTQVELDRDLRAASACASAIPSLRSLVFLTNSGRAPSAPLADADMDIAYVRRARKPWTRLSIPAGSRVVVCGDQPGTDGLLAVRMRCPFVQIGLPPGAPLWPRVQRHVMRMLAPLLWM